MSARNQTRLIRLNIPEMCCSAESSLIERALESKKIACQASYDTLSRTAVFTVDDDDVTAETFVTLIADLGMTASVISEETAATKRTFKFYVPEMCCSAETALIDKVAKGDERIAAIVFDTLSRTAVFTTARDGITAADIAALIESTGMSASEIRETKRTEVTIAIENMRSDGDAQKVLDLIGLDAALDKQKRTVRFETDAERILSILEKLSAAGFEASVLATGDTKKTGMQTSNKATWLRLAAALVLAGAAEAVELAGLENEILIIALALAAILLSGFETVIKGAKLLLRLIFTMDTLMSVAVVGAALLGAWPEAAMVMVLYQIGEAIEDLSMVRAKNAIRKLLDVAPSTVTVKLGGAWKEMSVEAVPAGALYRIEPGERAALDGMLEEGAGAMDESMITGESIPVSKTVGSRIFAGALALENTLVVRATAAASDSMSVRIIRAVEEAEQKKAPLQRFVDKFAALYTPTVFALSLLTAVLGTALTGDWATWIYRALALLVISCPCALVISTPVTVVSALSLAARRGILIKGGVYLEEGRRLKNVALDKTGTVTRGKPQFTSITVTGFLDENRALKLAASLAAMSSHPVSRAIAEHYFNKDDEVLAVQAFKALPGAGTEGKIEGALMRLTNLKWLEQQGPVAEDVRAAFAAAHEKGETAVALSDMFGVCAVIAVADSLKPNAVQAVSLMKSAGLTPWLLTGDNTRAAETIAAAAGIDNVRAELLPEQKLEIIEKLEAEAPTAMVGDGINDAPALSRAHIGFAMGIKGADTAIEAADVALMDDNIAKIAWFKRLSELTHRTLIENIALALGVKLCFALAALAGYATMWMAVFADTGVCLIVVAWGMRLMRAGKKVDALLD